jgi:hypothetical protein
MHSTNSRKLRKRKMNTRRTVLNTIAFFTFSTMVVVAQMQMPAGDKSARIFYTLEGHEAELDKLAGMKAAVKGKLFGERVTVQSVVPATKMQ